MEEIVTKDSNKATIVQGYTRRYMYNQLQARPDKSKT